MAAIKTFKLFLSHGFKPHDDYTRAVELLESYFRYGHAIISLPEDARYRRMDKAGRERELRSQIKNANCFIALDALYLDEDEWARYELEYAVSLGKPIVGIRRWKSRDSSVVLDNVARVVLGWNPEALVSAIVEHSVPVQINLR